MHSGDAHVGPFHLARPYGNESGLGWGRGEGTASGERLSGRLEWSNHPARRGDGAMLPNSRGVIITDDGATVLFELTGRTVSVERDGGQVGRQLLMMLLESDDDGYRWLNDTVAICEGLIDPRRTTARIEVYLCVSEL